MNTSKVLTILGYKYGLDLSKSLNDMGKNVGLCDLDYKIITIANDVDHDIIASTLLHEIVEIINYHLELGLEHRQIMGLEVGLHQALVDNGVNLDILFP